MTAAIKDRQPLFMRHRITVSTTARKHTTATTGNEDNDDDCGGGGESDVVVVCLGDAAFDQFLWHYITSMEHI